MRYSDFAVLPGTPQEAKNSVIDMLVVYKARNIKEVPIKVILKALHNQNFEIDRGILIDLIKDNPVIARITGNTIFLNSEEPEIMDVSPEEGDASEKRVEQLAKKASKIGEL